MSQIVTGLRERKRLTTHRRIAEEAARLVTLHGVSGTTVEQIASAADVARATFFRYFDSKETAIAEGFSRPWMDLLIELLRAQPDALSALDAVIATFAQVGDAFDAQARESAWEQAQIIQSSPTLQAWLHSTYGKFEIQIAEAVAGRFADLADHDPRPRMAGAAAVAAVRIGLEEWVAIDGRSELADLFARALGCVELHATSPAAQAGPS